jgi:sterol 3beta-glucosyltransferase
MATQAEEDMVEAHPSDGRAPAYPKSLKFPFRANTVARKARSPGPTELQYQLAKTSLNDTDAATADSGYFPDQEDLGERRSSGQSELSIGQPAREMMQDRIQKEEDIGVEEEAKEMSKVQRDLPTVAEVPSRSAEDDNTSAALREGSGEDEVVEDRMMPNPSEKKRLRKEQLAEKLQEVFGLAEREEVIDEMRCWLLRSISKCCPLIEVWFKANRQCSKGICTSQPGIYASTHTCPLER